MNRLILILFLFSCFQVTAQRLKDEKVPEAVKASFQKLYPDIKKPKWEMDKGNYEAEFRMSGTAQSALFDSSGTFLQMEVSIPVTEMPQAVKDYLNKNYPGEKVRELSRITKANGDILYEVEIKGRELLLDSAGQLM